MLAVVVMVAYVGWRGEREGFVKVFGSVKGRL